MRQSSNRKTRDVTAFLYERLSRDDNLEGESYSIQNQKKLLTKIAKEKGYTNLIHFMDDGISGVTMERPGFQDMIRQPEEGRAAAVFVKDLSSPRRTARPISGRAWRRSTSPASRQNARASCSMSMSLLKKNKKPGAGFGLLRVHQSGMI